MHFFLFHPKVTGLGGNQLNWRFGVLDILVNWGLATVSFRRAVPSCREPWSYESTLESLVNFQNTSNHRKMQGLAEFQIPALLTVVRCELLFVIDFLALDRGLDVAVLGQADLHWRKAALDIFPLLTPPTLASIRARSTLYTWLFESWFWTSN